MQFKFTINQILVLFIIILVGYISKKKGLISEETNKGLSNILIDITLPALIISSMTIELNPEIIVNISNIGLISIISYLSLIILAKFITRKLPLSQSRKTVFKFLFVFGNVGYMGYPIIKIIYPNYGIFYAIINNIVFNILQWTYGIYIFIKDKNCKQKIQFKLLLNNGIIAIIIGFILLFINYTLPFPVKGALKSIGNMTFPLSMLIIGSSLTNVNIKTIFYDHSIHLLSILKLLIIPLSGLLILKQFNFPDIITNINIILLAMPSAANGVILAQKYNGDYKFASEGVFFTTLLSLITIPFFIWLIQTI